MNTTIKKLTTLFLIFVMLAALSFQRSHAAVKFSDVPADAWYINALEKITLDSRGILQGYSDGTYKPQKNLDVCEFIKCIIAAKSLSVQNGKTYWAETYISKAIELGYVNENEFASAVADPYADYKRPITRGEMSRIVVRFLEDLEGKYTYRDEKTIIPLIQDYDIMNDAYQPWVVKAYDMGILGGLPDKTFSADKSLSRAEAVVVCLRLIDPTSRLKVEPVPPSTAEQKDEEELTTEGGRKIYVIRPEPGNQPLSFLDGISSVYEKIQAYVNSLGDPTEGEVTYHLFKPNFVNGYYYMDLIIRNGTDTATDGLYQMLYIFHGDDLQVNHMFDSDYEDLGSIAPGMSRYIRICVDDRDSVLVDNPAITDVTLRFDWRLPDQEKVVPTEAPDDDGTSWN